MTETIKQLKGLAEKLLQSPHFTNERIDGINAVAWQLRYVDKPFTTKLSREAQQLADRNDYARGRAFALRNLGWCQLLGDQYREAEQTLQESQRIFLNLHDDAGLAQTINALGVTKQRLSSHEAAAENFSVALFLHKKLGDTASLANTLNNLSKVYSRFSDYAQALDYGYQALEIASDSHTSPQLAFAYSNMTDVLWRVGESDQAIECAEQALAIYRDHQNQFNESATLINLGEAYRSRSKYQQALECFRCSLIIGQNLGSLITQAEAHRCIGSVYCEMDELQQALTHLERALQLMQSINSHFTKSEALLDLGLVYLKINNITKSVAALNQALELSQQLVIKEVCYKAHLALSEAYERQNKTAAALYHYQSFHRVWQEIHGSTTSHKVQRLLLKREFIGSCSKAAQLLPQASMRVISRDEHARLSPRKLKELTEFIDYHLEQSLTIDDVATLAGLSRRQFQDSFKQSTGKTLHQFLVQQRVARATQLLQTSNLPISEIALQCGFSSQSHLTSQFRLLTGTTPRQFRQSL